MVNNITTQKMVHKIKGWTYEEIQTKVAQEYDAWAEIAMKKRPLLQEYLRAYNVDWDKLKDWETVKSKSLYTYRNLFISSLYKNKPLVSLNEERDEMQNMLKHGIIYWSLIMRN